MKPGTTLDDLYFQFNMKRPLDFTGHSMSVSDVVVLHQGEEDKAFYVDRFGFAELPDFLLERSEEKKLETIGSLTQNRDELAEIIDLEKMSLLEAMEADGGPSDRTDRLQAHINNLEDELTGINKRLQVLLDEQEAEAFADEAAYRLGDRYISIQRATEGFEYSIYDEEYHLLDGGIYDDNPDKTMGEIIQNIADELKQPIYDAEKDIYSHTFLQGNIRQGDSLMHIDFDELMERTDEVGQAEIDAVRSAQRIVAEFRDNTERLFRPERMDGMRPADIEEAVREKVQEIIDEYNLDARIEDVIVSGSRCRGLDSAESDLDVVVSFSGTEREDDFFNILHDEKMFFGTVELDINPIGTEQTGTLAEYLPTVEKYLSEKSTTIDLSFKEPALALMEKYGYELVAEQDKEHDFTLIRPIGEEKSSGFDGWQMLHGYFEDVEELVEQHSLGTLRDRLDGDMSKIPYGIDDGQLRAAIHFKEEQALIQDFPEKSEAAVQAEKPKQVLTFTVAECSEFHTFGELHEGIPNLSDAVKIYQKICEESKINAIPALGFNLHTAGTSEYEDVQWDFLSGKRLDLDGLKYLPEMSQNAEVVEALKELASTYPDVEVEGRFPDEERGTFGPSVQKQEKETESMQQMTAEALATEIDRFAYETDTYEYKDRVDNRETNIRGIAESIASGQDGGARAYLTSFMEESEDTETVARAKELLEKLNAYKPLAKVEEIVEQNYNMIDDRINNLSQDPEEKKEPAEQKTVRIDEHKKAHQRVSMREKLKEKKAEIAERDSKPPEQSKTAKTQGMGVED